MHPDLTAIHAAVDQGALWYRHVQCPLPGQHKQLTAQLLPIAGTAART